MHKFPRTDERLRSALDGNQPERERLCADLLPLLGAYTNVEVRRPRGGRDGGRDLEAVYDQRIPVWGAISFRNSANDSNEHRRETIKKFKSDLKSAQKNNQELSGFVFLTNVDLTPKQIEQLREHAGDVGIAHTDIICRERLRHVLDSPKGFPHRLRYLDIEMSKEDQLAFIEQLSEKLGESVTGQIGVVNEQLRSVEFRQAYANPVRTAYIIVGLKAKYEPSDLGHFRVFFRIARSNPRFPAVLHPYSNLCIAGRDAYGEYGGGEGKRLTFGFTKQRWLAEEPATVQSVSEWYPSCWTRQFRLEVSLSGLEGFQSIADFDHSTIYPFVTQPLVDKLAYLGFGVDDYVLAYAPLENFRRHEKPGFDMWRSPLTDEELAIPWTCLNIKVHDRSKPPPLNPGPAGPASS